MDREKEKITFFKSAKGRIISASIIVIVLIILILNVVTLSSFKRSILNRTKDYMKDVAEAYGKTLEKEGNADIVRKFFQKYPQYVENYSRIPNEKEAVQYLKENLKAKPSDMGYGFITYVLKGVNVPYDLVDSEYL